MSHARPLACPMSWARQRQYIMPPAFAVEHPSQIHRCCAMPHLDSPRYAVQANCSLQAKLVDKADTYANLSSGHRSMDGNLLPHITTSDSQMTPDQICGITAVIAMMLALAAFFLGEKSHRRRLERQLTDLEKRTWYLLGENESAAAREETLRSTVANSWFPPSHR